jgi:hypothetical protein
MRDMAKSQEICEQISPAVLAASRADSLTLEAVMGFTVAEDHGEQERLLAHFTDQGRRIDRQAVIRMLPHEKVATDDPRFLNVTDSALLDQLTVEKLAGRSPHCSRLAGNGSSRLPSTPMR